MASSWNTELITRFGVLIGNEARALGIHVILGPGVNIHRSPLGGRNYEYYSEDPLLAGRMTASVVTGLESEGVGACPKHFTANNQETSRECIDTIISQRALREIYLKPFEIAVTTAHPLFIMTGCSGVNGVNCGENAELLQKVLRGDWGFEGAVMTDWGGNYDEPAEIAAGVNLIMPQRMSDDFPEAVRSGKIPESIVNEGSESF
jgi:beta-glucosidase